MRLASPFRFPYCGGDLDLDQATVKVLVDI